MMLLIIRNNANNDNHEIVNNDEKPAEYIPTRAQTHKQRPKQFIPLERAVARAVA